MAEIPASICHLFLAATGANQFREVRNSFVHPGMHGVCVVHGFVGAIHFVHDILKLDIAQVFAVTSAAIKHLPLPCLMAELYRDNKPICFIHLASGVLPFIAAISGKPDENVTMTIAALNICSLLYYSYDKNQEWGYYTAGFACLAYFTTRTPNTKILFPLAMAGVIHCSSFIARDFGAPPPRRR